MIVVHGQPQTRVDGIRWAAIEGLPRDMGLPSRDTVMLLHKSLAYIARMRLSIEVADQQVERAQEAVCDSERLLADLRKRGF